MVVGRTLPSVTDQIIKTSRHAYSTISVQMETYSGILSEGLDSGLVHHPPVIWLKFRTVASLTT